MWFAAGELRRLGRKYGAVKPDFYYDDYETHLNINPSEVTAVLELGVHRGGSLLMWMELFPRAKILGVDYLAIAVDDTLPRVRVLRADQTDTVSIGGFLKANGIEQLDIVIDDCSHLGLATKQSFWFLFEHFLRPGGFYVIEDWGTGYLPAWTDGVAPVPPDVSSEGSGIFRSHQHGIPGFVKQLVDCTDKFEYLVVAPAFVLFKKHTVERRAAINAEAEQWKWAQKA